MKCCFFKTDLTLRIRIFYGFSLAIILAACGRTSAPTSSTTQSSVGDSIPSIADHSLASDKYIDLGLPAYDRDWTGTDMATTLTALKTIKSSHPDQLPHYGSSNSEKIFARIISQQNFSFYRDKSLPLKLRFPDMLKYMENIYGITALYTSAFQERNASGDDLIELQGACLNIAEVGMELAHELLATLSKDAPNYPAAIQGFETMKGGVATMISGSLGSLTETQNYSSSARAKLLKYCCEVFPHLVPDLSTASQTEILHRLDTLENQPDLVDLKSDIKKLHDDVLAAINAAAK